MRIATLFTQQNAVKTLLARQNDVQTTQTQIATGRQNLNPADDPVAAARELDLTRTLSATEQFQDNITQARARLQIEESALSGTENLIFRAKELTIQAANDPLSSADRIAIKQEVDQLLDELASLANTRGPNGEFIFSGEFSDQPAFALDAETGRYEYQGGINRRLVAIGSERQVADNDLGYNVFSAIPSDAPDANEDGQRSLLNTLTTLSQALGGTFDNPPASITGTRMLRFGADYSVNNTSFTVTSDIGTATVTLNSDFNDLDSMVQEINDQLINNGSIPLFGLVSVDSGIRARANGNQLEFVSITPGADSSVRIDAGGGSFLTDAGFNDGESDTGVDVNQAAIQGGGDLSFGIDYSANPTQFSLSGDTGPVDIRLNGNFTNNLDGPGGLIDAINGQIPPDSNLQARAVNGKVEFISLTTGTESRVRIDPISGSFLNDAGFTNGQTGSPLHTQTNAALTDLDNALSRILEVRTSVGARLRSLDNQENFNADFILDTQVSLSATRDVDLTEAITRLNAQNVALQAAQQTFTRVQNLSLFNFL
ncbi:MAG: flagellar hook-associated protein FlgL [Methylococcales bacterium]|nr:flagellar hook-associated protein FlgL [Methylococcales bacterium]